MGMGFIAGKNDPCIFYEPKTGVRLAVVVVDDILVRGPPTATAEFYRRLAGRFDMKDPTYLTHDTPISLTQDFRSPYLIKQATHVAEQV